jgi:TatD DNase family protein
LSGLDLTDTHCHIQSIGETDGEQGTHELWAKDAGITSENVIAEAQEAGVNRLICVGCDYADSRLAVDFVKDRSNCWATIGIHPHEAKDYASNSKALKDFEQLVTGFKVVAVGECGLDYYYNHSPKEAQIEVLRFQIELALANNLPLIFHVREAYDDFWNVFNDYKGVKGVLHSFTDVKVNLELALSSNMYVGVNGIATFAKDEQLTGLYRDVPKSNLLMETDAPFLTPKPFRGSINIPKRLVSTAEYLASLRGEELQELAQNTTSNAIKLFGLDKRI